MKDFTASFVKWCLLPLAVMSVLVGLCLILPPALSRVCSWIVAGCVLLIAPMIVFQLSKYCSKTMIRLGLFLVILVLGVIMYSCDFQNQQERKPDPAPELQSHRGGAGTVTDPKADSRPAGKDRPAQTGKSVKTADGSCSGISVKSDNCDYLFSVVIGIFASLAEFFPSRGSYREWLSYPLSLKIAFLFFYLLSYMFVASFLLSLLGLKLINRVRLTAANFHNDRKYVFWCKVPGRKEKLLAKTIHENDKEDHVIFSAKESAIEDIRTFVDQMQHSGFLLCLRKPGQIHPECTTAKYHFFLTDDLNWNFRQARKVLTILQAARDTRKAQKKKKHLWHYPRARKEWPDRMIHFFLRVTDGENSHWAVEWADKIQHPDGEEKQTVRFIRIHLINESSIAARLLQDRYPLLTTTPGIEIDHGTCTVNGSFRILQLGFAEGGQAVLREMVCNGQFIHKPDTRDANNFSVTVVDRNSVLTSGYEARYPDAVRQYHISFLNMEVLSGQFYSWLEHNLTRFNRIIVSFWNDDLNLETAAIITRLAKYIGVDLTDRLYVRFSRSIGGKADEEKAGRIFPFRVFGSVDDCYRRDVIINESLDWKAKRVHRVYKDENRLPKRPTDKTRQQAKIEYLWHSLNMFTQESNRACADGLNNLLRLMNDGKVFDPETDTKVLLDRTKDLRRRPDGDPLLETLAETEHLRWNAFNLMHGIRPWPLSEIPETGARNGKEEGKPNDIDSRLRHGGIADYSVLPEVDKRFDRKPNILQNNDRILIRKMETILLDE